jgi:Rrf2 family protein
MRFFIRVAPDEEVSLLSQTAEYALRTVLHIAQQPAGAPAQTDAMAMALRIPRNYLSKILHRLAQEGVLSSTRGRGGGFVLAKPADQIALISVVGLFDSVEPVRQCLLGQPVCSDAHACDAHAAWKDVSDRVARFFRDTTVAALLGEAHMAAALQGTRRKRPA